jgi:hypothetical protein
MSKVVSTLDAFTSNQRATAVDARTVAIEAAKHLRYVNYGSVFQRVRDVNRYAEAHGLSRQLPPPNMIVVGTGALTVLVGGQSASRKCVQPTFLHQSAKQT